MASVPQLRLYKDETLNSTHTDRLNELYNVFKDDNPRWIVRQECLNLKNVDNLIFVFPVFEGAAFEHVRNLKARILSATCMLNSFKLNKRLPRSIIPIFSSSMLDLNVCCSNMEKKLREDIYSKVEMMRGKISKIFTEKVTHLVTTEVGSAKYHAAGSMKLPVMLADWVLEVWKESENEECHATDAKFLKYKCPIFHKLVICASGFSEEIKNKIKSLVESEGGTYRGDLVCGTTTHLVLNEAKGAKYEHAKLWKINVIKSEWIYESIKSGYCLPEKDFILETDNQTSTPTESRILNKQRKVPDIDISVINPNSNNMTKLVNETENNPRSALSQTGLMNQSSTSILTGNSNNQTLNKVLNVNKPMSNFTDLIKEFNSLGKIKLTLFDGIGIYCEINEPVISEKVRKYCNLGGAIRFDEYNSEVTHVIINQLNEKQCKSYLELNPEINIVTIDWFINSCKQNQLEDCKNYCVFKNVLNSVKTPKKRTRPEKSTPSISNNNSKAFDSDLNDCLSQYLHAEAALMKPPAQPIQFSRPQMSSLSAKFQQLQKSETENTNTNTYSENFNNLTNSSKLTNSNISIKKDNDQNEIFYNKKFQIIGFDQEEKDSIEKILIQKGAIVLPSYDVDMTSIESSKPNEYVDYTLFPLITSQPISNNNPATVYWMRRCLELNKLLPLNEDIFYQPIPRYNTDQPLNECVITISGFGQYEKDNIGNLCKLLGAKIQQSLSLKHTNEIMANTHLICKQAIGPKYMAAKSWNLPAVCAEWVIECCVMGMKADEFKYSIENQEAIQKDLIEALSKIRQQSDEMCSNSSYNTKANNTTLRSLIAPKKSDDHSITDYNPNDSSLTCHNESKKPRLEPENIEIYDQDEVARKIDSRQLNLNDSDGDLVLAAIENSAKFKKPNETLNYLTPCNLRLKELRRTEIHQPQLTPSENNSNKFSTPQWMKPDSTKFNDVEYFKNLNCDKALEMLKTPDAFNQSRTKKTETPLCELFTNAIHFASEKSKTSDYWNNHNPSPAFEYSFQIKKRECQINNQNGMNDQTSMDDEHIQPTPAHLKHTRQILKNVKVYVSRKLVKSQAELYQIVETLGGDFCWTYNQDVTHFVYSGKLTDNVKELKTAREDKKIIVEPEWIYACAEQNSHVDENLFIITSGSKSSIASAKGLIPINDDLMNLDNNDDVFQKENETIDEVTNIQEDKDDQIDLKRAFLDQLQDKLASLKTSNSINTSKKVSRNKSDISKSDLHTDENRSSNIDDETALMNNIDFNEINKLNQIKNSDLTEDIDEEEENSKRRQYNLKRKANLPSNISAENLDNKNGEDKSKYKTGNKLGKFGKDLEEIESSSPSLLNKDNKKFNSNTIAPSQIQVTYWNDDGTNSANLAPTQNIGRAVANRQKSCVNKTDNSSKTKTDAIAERIMTAARAARKT